MIGARWKIMGQFFSLLRGERRGVEWDSPQSSSTVSGTETIYYSGYYWTSQLFGDSSSYNNYGKRSHVFRFSMSLQKKQMKMDAYAAGMAVEHTRGLPVRLVQDVK